MLDENIGKTTAEILRKDRNDVVSVSEDYRGQADEAILKIAVKSKRIIVTLDKDFGTLVHLHSRKHTGVILLRLDDESPKNIYKILKSILKQPSKNLKGKFIVATETKIRLK